jgi:hypothetical protein
MYTVRHFKPTKDEYTAVAAIQYAVGPDERQFTSTMLQENDDEWPESSLNQRFVVEYDDRIVAVGSCYQRYWQSQPGTVHIDFNVHPDHAGQDVDKLLYDYILAFLSKCTPKPEILATGAREDRSGREQFLRDRGFQPSMRFPKATMHIASFDKSRFQSVLEKVLAHGIHIYTLSEIYELESNWKKRLYDLRWALIQDVPSVEPPTRPSLAEFQKMILDDPALDAEAWFVAVDETLSTLNHVGPFVGMSNLWINDPTRKRLDTGLTGVIRNYRVLKVCTIDIAQRLGAITIVTRNEENNPMYQINLKLGFQPDPAWICYRKELL